MTVKVKRPVKVKRVAELESLGDLLDRLGGVSPTRVLLTPPPGTATVRDGVRMRDRHKRLCELVDGTLVEKVMGAKESYVGVRLSALLDRWNDDAGNLGMILGADVTLKFLKKLVRIPDVSFTRWEQLPGRVVPAAPVPEVSPDLVVEVLSEGNTAREMERKLKEYFLAGVRLVWFVDDRTRSVRAYTSPDDSTAFGPGDTLTGGDVLPGFAVPVARLFENLPQTPPAKPRKRKKA